MAKRKPTNYHFIILFIGRDGSSAITSALNKNNEIFCYPEILSKNKKKLKSDFIISEFMKGEPLDDLFPKMIKRNKYLTKEKLEQKGPFTSVGLKTKIDQIADHSEFKKFLETNNFRVIHLVRRNVIKGTVSVINHKRLNKTHKISNAFKKEQIQNKPFKINPINFKKALNNRVNLLWQLEDFVSHLNVDKCKVYYEDYLSNPQEFMNKLFQFLEVENQEVNSDFLKNTPDKLDKILLNLNEIKNQISKSKYSYFSKYF